MLKADDSLMLQGTSEDAILRTWKDSVATINIGAYAEVSDSSENISVFS